MRKTVVKYKELSSNKVYDKKFDALFKKLVPMSGKAKTAEGELIRALAKVGYRWSNDGDRFFSGYGCETAGPSATFLMKSEVPGAKKIILDIVYNYSEPAYDKFIENLTKVVVDYVESKNGVYTKNTKDNLDTPSEWENNEEDDKDYYDEDDSYYDEDENEND